MRIKKSLSITLTVLLIFFVGGFIHATINILIQNYIQYSMFNLIIMSYAKIMTHWIMIGLFIYLLALALIHITQQIENRLEINNKTQKIKIVYILLSIVLFLFLFIFLVYFINKYYIPYSKFHTISLIADILLALGLLLIWLIIMYRKNSFSIIKKLYPLKYLHILSLIFLVTLIALKAFLFYTNMKKNNNYNVLLIIVDTLRADHLGCYGYFRDTTPHIDSLSNESILFMNAVSPAPWTSPAIASILASKYPAVMGITHDPVILSKKHLFLAEILKENYYRTKGIISHSFIGRELNYHQGFDSFDQEDALGGHFSITSPSITSKAIDFITKNKKNKFFLFLHYFDPHFAFMQHKNFNYFPDYNGKIKSGMGITKLRNNAKYFSENDLNYLRSLYDSEISFTDYYIGKIIAHLKNLNLYKNTMIIFTADHGETFCDRSDWIGHTRNLYHELIHVPLIMKLPEKKESIKVNKYIGTIDILPTILATLKIDKPKTHFDGIPMNLFDIDKIEPRVIISETKRISLLESVISNKYKVIKDLKKNRYEIYNLNIDPYEQNNLSPELDNDNIHNLKMVIEEWKKYVTAQKSQIGNVKTPHLSKKEKERLKSLGYIK